MEPRIQEVTQDDATQWQGDTPVCVPRIEEVGPSFKTDDEHFRAYKLDDGQYAIAIGETRLGRGDFIHPDLLKGLTLHYYENLLAAHGGWCDCADTQEFDGDSTVADNMKNAWRW
jgi:hypothetical protein